MSFNLLGGDRDQPFLMPPSLSEWLPEDHLAYFVVDVVSELDMSAFYADYRQDGRGGALYDPRMLVAVLIYAYCTGERSSRRIERNLVENVAYRVVAANASPDHATLARFRRRHLDAIAGLFDQVLTLCVTTGVVDAGLIAIDGTKIKANASFFANRTAEQLTKEILAEAEQADATEDARWEGTRGEKLPDGWGQRRDRGPRIRAALAELEGQPARDYESRMKQRAQTEAETGKKIRGPKPKPTKARLATRRRANTTDPESRIFAMGHMGAFQGYNAQAAATEEQVVVAAEVHATTNDQPHFLPMVEAVQQNLAAAGHRGGIGTVLADAGYWTAASGTAEIDAHVLIATRKGTWRKAERPSEDKLAVLARVNRAELSQRQAGEILGVSYTWVRDMTKRYFGTEGQRITRHREPEPDEWIPIIERVNNNEISKRAAADELCVSSSRINTMLAHVRGEATDPTIARKAMDARLAEPENKAKYKKRSHTIEPVFGNIKNNLGYRSFHLRGIRATNSEWRLICASHNLLKLRQHRQN